MSRRVVITGMGAVTPLGLNVDEFWNGLKEGRHGFGPITQFDASEYKCKVVGEVKGFVAKIILIQRPQEEWQDFHSSRLQQQRKQLQMQSLT